MTDPQASEAQKNLRLIAENEFLKAQIIRELVHLSKLAYSDMLKNRKRQRHHCPQSIKSDTRMHDHETTGRVECRGGQAEPSRIGDLLHPIDRISP